MDAALSGNAGKLTSLFHDIAGRLYTGESKSVGYVHIRNARFFQPGGGGPIPQVSSSWWRGRLSEVSGFVIGEMMVSEPQ